MLENCLFGAVSLTKNPDIDQYKYSGYGIGFDRHGEFSFGNGYGKNCVIFGADLSSSSMHVNYKKKKKTIYSCSVKTLHKELMVQQFMEKDCIKSTSLKILKNFI